MNSEQIEEVWRLIDRDHLAAVACTVPGVVFATISGAHLYGFASPDSDVDLRGAFLLPARALLGLRPSKETITVADKTIIDLDWVAHDLRKFARLMTNHNGYVLEQLYSPLVVHATPLFAELQALGRGCVTRPTVRHYQGFARGCRKRLHEPEPTVKHLLYAYRVLLTGIHMMQSGEVVANLSKLNQRFALAAVDELVERKRLGAEHMSLSAVELASHDAILDRLDGELAEAHERSALPEVASSLAALDDFVIRVRLEAR